MTPQKHSGYHILLAYHNCVSSDLIVTLNHSVILLNLKTKTKLEAKKNPALMECIGCYKYQSIFFFQLI